MGDCNRASFSKEGELAVVAMNNGDALLHTAAQGAGATLSGGEGS